jgi:hypothetical protein
MAAPGHQCAMAAAKIISWQVSARSNAPFGGFISGQRRYNNTILCETVRIKFAD